MPLPISFEWLKVRAHHRVAACAFNLKVSSDAPYASSVKFYWTQVTILVICSGRSDNCFPKRAVA